MNVVLHNSNGEPITVIDLPMEMFQFGQKQGWVTLVRPYSPIVTLSEDIRLEFHKLRMQGDVTSWFITVRDDVGALALHASYLPGQRDTIDRYKQKIESLERHLTELYKRGRA